MLVSMPGSCVHNVVYTRHNTNHAATCYSCSLKNPPFPRTQVVTIITLMKWQHTFEIDFLFWGKWRGSKKFKKALLKTASDDVAPRNVTVSNESVSLLKAVLSPKSPPIQVIR